MRCIYILVCALLHALPALAGEVTVPLKHLSDQELTQNYAKAIITNLSGYITTAGLKPIRSQVVSKFGPGITVTIDGKNYLKVPTTVEVAIKGKSSSLESFTLYNLETLNPVKSFQPDGEVTIYRQVNNYPDSLRVGEIAFLSNSDTYAPGKYKSPVYTTRTLLSLVRVQGEKDLFEFCETDYEYRGKSKTKKADSELSNCLIIDAKGSIQGYAVLINEQNSRSTYTGTIKIE